MKQTQTFMLSWYFISDFNQIWILTDFNKVSNIKFHKNLSSASPADTSKQA
jgi:hypothetical protein